MRTTSFLLVIALISAPAGAQTSGPLASAARAATAEPPAASGQPRATTTRGKLFWPGIALGAAGATLATLSLTTLRVDDRSAGNSPSWLYQDCVTRARTNPVYATSDCNALKGRNAH